LRLRRLWGVRPRLLLLLLLLQWLLWLLFWQYVISDGFPVIHDSIATIRL
jgi:hypothetical protein